MNDYYVTPEEYEKAKNNGISYSIVNSRIRSYGWNKERALTEKPIIRDRHLNEKYVDLAKNNGISREAYAYRVSHGYSEYEAATIPIKNRKKHMSELGKGKRKYSKEIIELARSNGISIRTFYRRIQKDKWSPMKAATTPLIVGRERALLGAKSYEKIHGYSFATGGGL